MRHLRAEATSHVLQYRAGELQRSGRGLAFWFFPMAAALAEVPVDDRDLNFLFTGRTRDYQEVTVQGVITYRVLDAERLAARVDFGLDLDRGTHKKQPLEQLSALLTGIAQQAGLAVIARAQVAELLVDGFDAVVAALQEALRNHPTLEQLGIALLNVRLDDLKPNPDLERALQTPTRESLQQRADEAMFQRRALAVEKERAIAENELQTRVELARREESLIDQQGKNARHKVEKETEAKRLAVLAEAENEGIEATAAADRQRLEASANAETVRLVAAADAERTRVVGLAEADKVRAIGEATATGERLRLQAYKDLPPQAVLALAAQEIAGQLQIDNITVTPDMLGQLLQKAAQLGLNRLETGASE
jgi:regulator of protease activity HflC (stomatin/prohibitin superfamily)